MSTTVTTKGQVTIPKQMRDSLGLTPGSLVDFAWTADGQVVIRPVKPARNSAAFGTSRKSRPAVAMAASSAPGSE